MRPVDIVGLQLEPHAGVSLVVLREHDPPNRLLPIFIGAPEAASIAIALSGEQPPRPLVHDLMAALVQSLGAAVDSVEVTDVREGTFIARVNVRGAGGQRQLDSRPSDAIALAVRTGAALFVGEAVLEQAGALVAQLPDEQSIDEAVAQFRGFLEELSPADFVERVAEPPQPSLGPPDEQDEEGSVGGGGVDEP